MLGFFRKYQKFFFIIVTFFIVISFSFFGTFNAFMKGDHEQPNKEIGHLVDGTVLKEREFYGLIRLLQHGIEEGGRSVNLLNDSLIHREIILSGLGEGLAGHFFEELEPELSESWKRAKRYQPYVHPYSGYLSARGIWSQFAPKINALLDELHQAPDEFTKEQVPLLFKLYEAQAAFPTPLLHQMLYYQQRQNDIRPDPDLPHANVALFGFQSIEDWFGAKFVEKVATFVLNAACVAREEGYKVSKDEAYLELASNVYRGLKMYAQTEHNPTNEEVQNTFTNQIRSLGLTEAFAVDQWRKVMHFRRFFDEVGEATFLDRLAFNQFSGFAKPSHKICRYELPQELQFSHFRELLKFQRYLEATSAGDGFSIPTQFYSAEQVKEKHPELVYKSFEVEFARVSKLSVASRVSLKQTWDWEAQKDHFAILQEEFSALNGKESGTEEARVAALEELDELTRFKVDQRAREHLIEKHPEWIDGTLAEASVEKETLQVGLKGEGALDGASFLALLESEDSSLSRYSLDGETFYHIKVLEKNQPWQLFSFKEANQKEILDEMLDSLLEVVYENMGIDEPFNLVKDEVGEKVYTDVLQKIASLSTEAVQTRDDYARHRFDGFLEQMRTLAMENPASLECASFTLQQYEEFTGQTHHELAVGEFSPVENRSFFQLIEQEQVSATDEEIKAAKQLLKRDAQTVLLKKILTR